VTTILLMLLGVTAQATQPPLPSFTLCVTDAQTRAPLVGAEVTVAPATRRLAASCALLHAAASDSVRVARLGYLPHVVHIPPTIPGRATNASDTIWVALLATSAPRAARLAAVQVSAARITVDTATGRWSLASSTRSDLRTAGRTTATLSTSSARTAGASTMNGMLALMPFTALRTARGETALSLRGARREQVAITLNGLPLNDPATGIADVSDLPLAGLQSVTVALGADPIASGAGASGGVVALTTSAERVASLSTGAFGQSRVEAAWHLRAGNMLWHVSGAHNRALNNFDFLNSAGAVPQRETRINNDEQRTTASLGVMARRLELLLLASHGERGMVGPANVRSADADRAVTSRQLLRAQTTVAGTTLLSGVRRLQLRYVDPMRPALDTRATAWAADAEWRGAYHDFAWRVGGGTDQLEATGNIVQRRRRAFSSVQRAWGEQTHGRWSTHMGARADVVEGSGLLPTATIGAERRLTPVGRPIALEAFGRAAQAVRVPTLYDLYFSSPQRLSVKALAPERVTLDVSSGLRLTAGAAHQRVSLEGSVVARNTRDAIVWFPGNFGWSPANVGIERLRGIESRAELTLPLPLHFAPGSVQLMAWATAYDAALTTGGLRIPTPYVSRLTGGAQLQLQRHRQSAALMWRGNGARPYTAGPRNPDFELPPVSLLDLSIAQRLQARPHGPWPHTSALIALSLENVTNVAWQSVRGFPSPGRTWAISFTLQHTPP
jgi:outer membrane cobalamin receptor